jgi:Domain of unknown function (DUF4149)
MRYRFGLMIAALWWGSLTALGFVIVPMLFTHLPSPAAAGQMAAKLFTAQTPDLQPKKPCRPRFTCASSY